MRSKVFWLVVLALAILVAVISCYAPRYGGGSEIIPPMHPIYDEPEYPLYEYDESDIYEPYIEETLPPDPGELDLQTNNVFVAGRYAGFLTWGYFRHSAVYEDIAIADSQVRDTYTGAILYTQDIIDTEMMDKVLSLLAGAILAHTPQAAPYLYMIEADWLRHLVIDHEGLRVMLAPDITPWDLGFMHILLTYEELDEAFLLGVELGLREPPHRPMVALTFDDGPSSYTDMILDILEAHGARATFCVLGNRIHHRPETLVRAVASGSEVIGHSWDHSDFTRLNASAISSQITRTSAEIEAATGISPPPLVRVPYGATNSRVINTARDLGYSLLHWSVDPQDWANRDAYVIYEHIMRRAIEGSIILLHDIHTSTAEAMTMVIPRLIEEGFQLVTASELIAHHYGELEAGEVYKGFRNPW